MRPPWTWCIVVASTAAGACAAPATEADYDAAVPAAKIHAIGATARQGDATELVRLVEQLDSDDPAVRLYAILTLERLTGQTLGYRYEAPEADREAAVERWVEYANDHAPAAGTATGASRNG